MPDLHGPFTAAIRIVCPPRLVARYVTDPRNLPHWASAFCKSVRFEAGQWRMTTDQGEATIRFIEPDSQDLLDHEITLPSGLQVRVPMRVRPLAGGCEVSLTISRQQDMTEADFLRDIAMVESDLARLRAMLEPLA